MGSGSLGRPGRGNRRGSLIRRFAPPSPRGRQGGGPSSVACGDSFPQGKPEGTGSPPGARFLSGGERNRGKKAAKGNLRRRESHGQRIRARTANACGRSIAPPLHPKARGFGVIMDGIGGFLWNPSPTAKGAPPPLDPRRGTNGKRQRQG